MTEGWDLKTTWASINKINKEDLNYYTIGKNITTCDILNNKSLKMF